MSDFTPNTVGHFKVVDASVIEEWDADEYGNQWYAVRFEGEAETFLWLAKNEPVDGKEYYGHIEPTKSGKRLRFKTDKMPDKPKAAATGSAGGFSRESPEIQESINRSVALNDAALVFQGQGISKAGDVDNILGLADDFYAWLSKPRPAAVKDDWHLGPPPGDDEGAPE